MHNVALFVVAFVVHGIPYVLATPVLSLDLDPVLTLAFSWVGMLMPIYAIPLGIAIGIGLLTMIYTLLSKAFHGSLK